MSFIKSLGLENLNKSIQSYLKKPNASLVKVLLLFYLIVGNSFTQNLYSGQLTQFISQNREIQHVIGFITMMVLVSEFGGIKDPQETIIYSLLAYFWFLLSTKIDLHWSLAIIAILTLGYLYENKLEFKEMNMEEDEAIEEEDMMKVTSKNDQSKKYLFLTLFVLTLIGLLYYFSRKRDEYGEDFDTVVFVFGPGKKNMPLYRSNQMMY